MSQPSEAIWLFEQLGKPARLRMVYDYSHYAYRDLLIDETVRESLPWTAHMAAQATRSKPETRSASTCRDRPTRSTSPGSCGCSSSTAAIAAMFAVR